MSHASGSITTFDIWDIRLEAVKTMADKYPVFLCVYRQTGKRRTEGGTGQTEMKLVRETDSASSVGRGAGRLKRGKQPGE